ncbi:peroxidase 6-like [Neltuma alba]|uniref:peroxidase 6-like n=1 Tax=Neltuma alba TaxID=207710 RepID=UPI0010A302BD|nr:peroxidase 6-like [Prosopis alba]XP_028782523.1 peroxidase 6-like [Prosopis alba]
MAFPLLFLCYFFLVTIPFSSSASHKNQLSLDYYKKTCPKFQQTVAELVYSKQSTTPSTAPGVLRLFFHDCITDGCDASILISSNGYMKAERDADLNLSLSAEAFDLILKIKNALELTCPGVVSCADIMAQSTRDLIKMVGGPYYTVPLGRKDSLSSNASKVDAALPKPDFTMDKIIEKFTSKNFTVREMVALTGGHTIGFTHCKEFAHRIFGFSKTSQVDPTMNPKLVEGLKKLCANYTKDPSMSAFNDMRSPGKFDNAYYQNVLHGLGLLSSDSLLGRDPRTKPIVEQYAKDQNAFFQDFAKAMEKLEVLGVKTGKGGEVRQRCDQFNNMVPTI